MRETVLVAPDAFKGTHSAAAVAEAIATGLSASGAHPLCCPVADGGEGTIEVLLDACVGVRQRTPATDAIGRRVLAEWALLDDGVTAVVEAAQASGLALIATDDRDAERASSAGTGELILAAGAAGARRIVVAVGGTATTDGGLGALAAIDAGGGLGDVELVVACDVSTPFERAAEIFAPQKGASADAVRRLADGLDAFARTLPRDPRGVAMTGAGGGLAGGLWARHGARLVSGADYVLDALGFAERLAEADAVVIGEGRLDEQSLTGKVTGVIIRRAAARGVPVHAVVGSVAGVGERAHWAGLESIQLASSIEQLTAVARRWPWTAARR